MTFDTDLVSQKFLGICLMSIAALFIASAAVPKQAHAADLTIVVATTTTSNASTTLSKVGDTVHFGLQLSGTPEATTTPTINIFSMGTTSFTGSGAYWQYSTTSASTWTTGFLTFYMAWGGSVGEATTTYTQTGLTGPNVRFDKTAPTISSITSSPSCNGSNNACRVGDIITFTLTPGATEYGATISGSYNSVALTWSTSDSGATYTATYTVANGQQSQTSSLQISGVIITDAAGNASAAGAGTDVTKTISVGGGSSTTITYYGSPGSSNPLSPPTSVATTNATTTAPSTLTTPTKTSALTSAQVSAIISLLQSFGADAATIANVQASLTGGTPSGSTGSATFTRDLSSGSTGADVTALQNWLIAKGFSIPAGATGYFGTQTKAAVAAYQASKGIAPAAGRLGPATRASVSSSK